MTLFWKRLFDITASSIGLLVLLPVFMVLAIWIKRDSAGPVFFRQHRVGKNGRLFSIHKFRSMYLDTEKVSRLTVGADSRITPSGRFIRKYKLDELPQLIDVVVGNMSLVGPRPEVPEFMNLYPTEQRQKILSVRPGITDRAAIEMVDENDILMQYENPHQAYVNVIMPLKARYYLQYIEHISLAEDIKIILATLKKIVSR
ncbi:sugar transferase [Paralysiella testudinis]|uniref:Sugar transferase n=1 Tax=Paralysiella testudinis TaxID=2809020 RepID=A0A892ZLK2_9NEIS|nr:sugar transferase [Paralysiella testudinis]QRQ82444.1 sugar transferase [Paralysiella testudinis]